MLHFAYIPNKVSNTLVANPTSEHGFAVVKDAVSRRLTPLQLEELLGRGAHGDSWRARLADGSRVAVKRMFSVGEDPAAFFQRLERASAIQHANLLEVIRTLEENHEMWVVSRLGTGVPLDTLLKAGRMRSGCAVAVGMGILSGLTAIHQAGLWHGSVHGRNVHVDMDGTVRLGDHCLGPAPAGQSSAALRAADVRAAGALICSMLRVPLDGTPAAAQRQALKVASSPLGLAAKAIAGPPRKLPAGYEAAHASLTLWEAARKMATSRRQAQARHDLADMVRAALGAPFPTVVHPSGRHQGLTAGLRPALEPALVPGAPSGGAATPAPPSPAIPAPAATVATATAGTVPPLRAKPAPPQPAAESRELPPPPQRAPIADRAPAAGPALRRPPVAAVRAPTSVTMRRPTRRGVPWSLLALLAAALLIGVCVLMAVASAVPGHRRASAPVRPAPTQPAPAPAVQAPAPSGLPAFGDVPVTTPIVVVPAAPGTAPAAAPGASAPDSQASPRPPETAPGTSGTIPPAPGVAPSVPPPAAAGSARLQALADLPPAGAGDVLLVSLDASGCSPGSACTISVQVALQSVPSRRYVSWTLSSVDLCTGRSAQLATVTVLAQPGWNHVIGMSTVTLPAVVAQVLVAITDSPARTASSLVAVGSSHCS